MHNLVDAFRQTAIAVAEHDYDLAAIAEWNDEKLLAAQSAVAAHRRRVDAIAATLAGETARRSSRELGYTGLAQKAGLHTPEELIRSVTGITRAEASRLVAVGTLLGENEAAHTGLPSPGASSPSAMPWHEPIAEAVGSGRISVEGADAVRRGLGTVSAGVTDEQLRAAVYELLERQAADAGARTAIGLPTATANPDRLYRDARDLRDRLDADGVTDREALRRSKRSLRRWTDTDGMRHANLLLDAESAEIFDTAIDAVISPRRGGPRFVNPAEANRSRAVLDDPRTTEQLALDTLIDIIRIAGTIHTGTVFGTRRPEVKIIVHQKSLTTQNGIGYLETSREPISLMTVERHLCDTGAIPVITDAHDHPLDVGRDQRLFTRRQRDALAVRDGGCLWPECDKPPSWTETHHIRPWTEGGRTDIADGVLLCRHHHMLLHNNGWRIDRSDSAPPGPIYRLVPPPDRDPAQKPVALRSKALWSGSEIRVPLGAAMTPRAVRRAP